MEYEPRRCYVCGDALTKMVDGREIFMRCRCEWEKGFQARLVKTVAPTFYKPKVKRMDDLRPTIFLPRNAGMFPSFIRMQKVVAVLRIWNYCFADVGEGQWSALPRSVMTGQNLFIRGPHGSGRGLMSACIKFIAAKMDISVTPLTGEFDAFKNDMLESKALGREGLEAKAIVAEKYGEVKLLVLENCRAEKVYKYSGEETPSKFRGANEIDNLLARRQMSTGAMVLTSDDFAGEISNTMGDRLLEVLASDLTRMALMLSVGEADDLLAAVVAKYDSMQKWIQGLGGLRPDKTPERKGALEKLSDQTTLRMVEEALFFEEAFPNIPSDVLIGGRVGETIAANADKYMPAVLALNAAFREGCSRKGAEYKRGIAAARAAAVRSCKSLASRMIEKEMEEVGGILSLACGPREKMESLAADATQKRAAMSKRPEKKPQGEGDGHERTS